LEVSSFFITIYKIKIVMKKWTKEELEKAIELLKNGYKYDAIALELERTNRSIKNKLEEVGLKYYVFNPTKEKRKCINCNGEFEILKTDIKKFCGSSCAAIFNNKKRKTKVSVDVNERKKREYHIRKKKECENCKVITTNKYCGPKCQNQHRREKIFEEIENGNTKLYFKNYKNYLIYKHGEKCMECGWCERSKYSNNVPIELEHIDGDSENNNLINLKLLCPNCHSLTPTYKALNKGNGRHSRIQRYKDGKSY